MTQVGPGLFVCPQKKSQSAEKWGFLVKTPFLPPVQGTPVSTELFRNAAWGFSWKSSAFEKVLLMY